MDATPSENTVPKQVPFWFDRSTCVDAVVKIEEGGGSIEFASSGGYCRMKRMEGTERLWEVHYTLTTDGEVTYTTPEFAMSASLLLYVCGLDENDGNVVEVRDNDQDEFCIRGGRLVSLRTREDEPVFSIFLTDDLTQELVAALKSAT